jgi:glutaredoxin
VYGTSWCWDCKRAKRFLGDQQIADKWVDVEHDEARTFVEEHNDG